MTPLQKALRYNYDEIRLLAERFLAYAINEPVTSDKTKNMQSVIFTTKNSFQGIAIKRPNIRCEIILHLITSITFTAKSFKDRKHGTENNFIQLCCTSFKGKPSERTSRYVI